MRKCNANRQAKRRIERYFKKQHQREKKAAKQEQQKKVKNIKKPGTRSNEAILEFIG